MTERPTFSKRSDWKLGDKKTWEEREEANFGKGLAAFPRGTLEEINNAAMQFFFPGEAVLDWAMNNKPLTPLTSLMGSNPDAEVIVCACVIHCISREILRREFTDEDTRLIVKVVHGSDDSVS